MGYLVIFGFLRFRPKINFHFCFIFRFHSKNVICIGPKMLSSQLNRNYKFCDRHGGWLSFSFFCRERNFIFVGIFVYGRKWNIQNAFSVGLYIKLLRITPYVNVFQTFNNPGILLNLVEPDVARATRWSSPAGHWLSAFVGIHHQTQCIMFWYSRVQAWTRPDRDKRRWRNMSAMVDKPDRWSTSALETWAHQQTSSICRWHLMWKASSVFMSATKRVYVSVP